MSTVLRVWTCKHSLFSIHLADLWSFVSIFSKLKGRCSFAEILGWGSEWPWEYLSFLNRILKYWFLSSTTWTVVLLMTDHTGVSVLSDKIRHVARHHDINVGYEEIYFMSELRRLSPPPATSCPWVPSPRWTWGRTSCWEPAQPGEEKKETWRNIFLDILEILQSS